MTSEATARRLLFVAGGLAAVGLTSLGLTLAASDDSGPVATEVASSTTFAPTTTLPPESTLPTTTLPSTTLAPETTSTTVAPTFPSLAPGQVLVYNAEESSVGVFDIGSGLLVSTSAPLPGLPPALDYQTSGGTTALYDQATGRLWVGSSSTPVAAVPNINPESLVVVTAGGKVLVVTKEGWYVLANDATKGSAQPERKPVPPLFGDDTTVTAVGERLVYLNPNGTLFADDWETKVPPGVNPVLQQAGADSKVVFVASASGLFKIELDSGEPPTPVHPADGRPARPVLVGECVHAAWTGEQPIWYRSCGDGPPVVAPLSDQPLEGQLVFRVNGAAVALNDVQSGDVWIVEGSSVRKAVDDWKVN